MLIEVLYYFWHEKGVADYLFNVWPVKVYLFKITFYFEDIIGPRKREIKHLYTEYDMVIDWKIFIQERHKWRGKLVIIHQVYVPASP